jgi:hypothetical protein
VASFEELLVRRGSPRFTFRRFNEIECQLVFQRLERPPGPTRFDIDDLAGILILLSVGGKIPDVSDRIKILGKMGGVPSSPALRFCPRKTDDQLKEVLKYLLGIGNTVRNKLLFALIAWSAARKLVQPKWGEGNRDKGIQGIQTGNSDTHQLVEWSNGIQTPIELSDGAIGQDIGNGIQTPIELSDGAIGQDIGSRNRAAVRDRGHRVDHRGAGIQTPINLSDGAIGQDIGSRNRAAVRDRGHRVDHRGAGIQTPKPGKGDITNLRTVFSRFPS